MARHDIVDGARGMLGELILPGRGLFQLTHFVTAACDARCAHCFYTTNRRGHELDLGEIEQIARSLGQLRFLLISGGEPFLRGDLPEIVQAYFRHTALGNLSIPTNGLRTEEILSAVERICGISPRLSFSLSVSLDGLGELHDALRGVRGIYERALRTLAGATRLRERYGNLYVGVVSTLMRENAGGLDRLIEFVHHEIHPDSHTLNLWRGDGPSTRPAGVNPDTYEALNMKLARLYSGGAARGLKRHVRDRVNELRYRYIARVWREGRFIAPCRAGERELVLAEDGEVFPCELMFNRSLGNVRAFGYDLHALRHGARTREFLAWRRAQRCFCTHECNTRTMLLLRPSTWARVLLPAR